LNGMNSVAMKRERRRGKSTRDNFFSYQEKEKRGTETYTNCYKKRGGGRGEGQVHKL